MFKIINVVKENAVRKVRVMQATRWTVTLCNILLPKSSSVVLTHIEKRLQILIQLNYKPLFIVNVKIPNDCQ